MEAVRKFEEPFVKAEQVDSSHRRNVAERGLRVTTCSNAADQLLRTNTSPKIVIIDEAGVAKEIEALFAIYHNLIVFTYVLYHDSTEAATIGYRWYLTGKIKECIGVGCLRGQNIKMTPRSASPILRYWNHLHSIAYVCFVL